MNFLVTKYKIITPFLVLGTFFLLATGTVHAQKYTREVNRTYEVFDEYVQITESRQIRIDNPGIYIAAGNSDSTTIFADIRPDTELIDNSQDSIDSLTVKRSNGTNYTNYSIDSSASNPIVVITFDRDIEYNSPFTVEISYRSKGVIYKSGKVSDIFIPGFTEDFVFSDSEKSEVVNTTVRIPKSLGDLSFAIPNGVIKTEGDYSIVTFSKEDLVGRSAWIEIGTEQVYEFSITQDFPRSSDILFGTNTYKIVLPRNINSGNINQEVFFTEISPNPVAIYEDENGNLIGEFTVPSKDSGSISIKGYAKLSKVAIDYTQYTGNISEIPTDIIDSNTAPAEYWESDHSEIKQAAIEGIGELDPTTVPVFSIAEALYEYVIEKIDYSNVKRFGINERQGALKTLQGGAAVCMEYSDLYIALLRSLGIPARAVLGYGYTGIDSSDSSEHQWVEVFIPELGWISVDTTWGESAPELIGGDLNHFFVHVASEDPNTPAAVEIAFIGDLGDINERVLSVVPTSAELNGTSAYDLISQYPQDESTTKSRSISFESGIQSLKDFYKKHSEILNAVLIFLVLILTVPLVFKIVKWISKNDKRNKMRIKSESNTYRNGDRKAGVKQNTTETDFVVDDKIPPSENAGDSSTE